MGMRMLLETERRLMKLGETKRRQYPATMMENLILMTLMEKDLNSTHFYESLPTPLQDLPLTDSLPGPWPHLQQPSPPPSLSIKDTADQRSMPSPSTSMQRPPWSERGDMEWLGVSTSPPILPTTLITHTPGGNGTHTHTLHTCPQPALSLLIS